MRNVHTNYTGSSQYFVHCLLNNYKIDAYYQIFSATATASSALPTIYETSITFDICPATVTLVAMVRRAGCNDPHRAVGSRGRPVTAAPAAGQCVACVVARHRAHSRLAIVRRQKSTQPSTTYRAGQFAYPLGVPHGLIQSGY